MNSSPTSRAGSILLGIGLVALGCLAIYFTRDFGRTGLGNNNDPGARFFPLVLASALGLWGLGSLVRDIWSWVQQAPVSDVSEAAMDRMQAAGECGTPLNGQEFVGQRGMFRMAVMACGLVGYVALIGPLGFTLSTLFFSTAVMTWLGNRWWVALLTATAMVIVVRVLFAVLFKVQLPTGEIGLPL